MSDPLSHACPRCHAAKGEWCVKGGRGDRPRTKRERLHPDRLSAGKTVYEINGYVKGPATLPTKEEVARTHAHYRALGDKAPPLLRFILDRT